MGAINNLAGAAGVLGLFGLEELFGLDAKTANTTMRLSAIGIGVSGLIGFRSRGLVIPKKAWGYGLIALPGAALGAFMATELPVWLFRSYLIIVLTTVLLQQMRNRSAQGEPKGASKVTAALLFLLVGMHLAFVQVATGLVAIGALTLVHSRNLVEINAAKMAIVICSALVANGLFALGGQIVWVPALALATGCGIGSFMASRWSVDKGHGAVRAVVIVITLVALVRLVSQMLA